MLDTIVTNIIPTDIIADKIFFFLEYQVIKANTGENSVKILHP